MDKTRRVSGIRDISASAVIGYKKSDSFIRTGGQSCDRPSCSLSTAQNKPHDLADTKSIVSKSIRHERSEKHARARKSWNQCAYPLKAEEHTPIDPNFSVRVVAVDASIINGEYGKWVTRNRRSHFRTFKKAARMCGKNPIK